MTNDDNQIKTSEEYEAMRVEGRRDAMIQRSGDQLLERYGLTAHDDGIRPNGFELHDEEFQLNILRLLNETMLHAATAIADDAIRFDGTFSSWHLDDHQDYLNAAVDQLEWLRNTFADCDGDNIAELTLALINATEADLLMRRDGGYPALGFMHGYCDHYTPLSALCLMNLDQD